MATHTALIELYQLTYVVSLFADTTYLLCTKQHIGFYKLLTIIFFLYRRLAKDPVRTRNVYKSVPEQQTESTNILEQTCPPVSKRWSSVSGIFFV